MLVNDDNLSDDKKLELFNQSFNVITNTTIGLISESIFKIVINNQEVTDKKHILEFVQNIDKELFNKIQTHINELKEANEIKPLELNSSPEFIERGAPATYKIPLNFNNSDFFGNGF
jgi:hypothetical protein